MTGDHLTFVHVLEHFGDHGRGGGATVDFATDIAFVNGRERIPRLVGRQKSREPRRRAFFVFRSPLCGAGFTSHFDVAEARLMSGAARAVNNIEVAGKTGTAQW